jgi:hypothetical protein
MANSSSRLLIGDLYQGDFVGTRITYHAQPESATDVVVPQLGVRTGRVVAQVNRFDEASLRIGSTGVGPDVTRIAQIGKLRKVSLAAKWTLDAHDRGPSLSFNAS